jgi:hypothetical protein
MADEIDEDEKWLQEQWKLLNIKNNYKREPMEYINLHFCYVDAENSIVNLKTEKHTFSDLSETQIILEKELFTIIEEKKHDANINYVFSELSLFVVDLEPENIQSIEPSKAQFFKTLPFVSDVTIPPSIFIFHPLNSLFFLFKRRKSILKQSGTKSTKKVSFSPLPSKKHTRRNI